MSNPLIRASDH